MKTLVPVFLVAAAVAAAQSYRGGVGAPYRGAYAPQPMGSVRHAPLPGAGYSSVLHPGGLHPGYGGGYRNNWNHGRSVVAYPVYVGPGYPLFMDNFQGLPDQQPVQEPPVVMQQPIAAPPAQAPTVIINQYFRADGSLESQDSGPEPGPSSMGGPAPAPGLSPRPSVADEKPTIYLIAFRDHTIMPVLAYWIQGDTLTYITKDGNQNTASMSLIDKNFSEQLNDERRIEFSLR